MESVENCPTPIILEDDEGIDEASVQTKATDRWILAVQIFGNFELMDGNQNFENYQEECDTDNGNKSMENHIRKNTSFLMAFSLQKWVEK